MRSVIMFTLGIGALAPATAVADQGFEAGFTVGGHVFSTNSELGVSDRMDAPSPRSSGLLGGRVGYFVRPDLAGELELVLVPTTMDTTGGGAMAVFGFRAHARYEPFGDQLARGKLRPFVFAGYGGLAVRGSTLLRSDVDQAIDWGVGARYALTRSIDLRIDAKHVIVPDRSSNGATSNFELAGGLSWRFELGRLAPRSAVVPSPSPDPDNDRDGVPDRSDHCRDDPETRNGYLDDDGCPDDLLGELAGITFAPGSDTFTAASATILERAYQVLRSNPAITLEISGHSSDEGDARTNLVLSQRRASAVKEYLVRRGIGDARLRAVGHGDARPLTRDRSPDQRTRNRRVEFRVVPPSR